MVVEAQIISFIKIRPVGPELFHGGRQANGRMDGWTDMTKLIVAFRNFATAPTNQKHISLSITFSFYEIMWKNKVKAYRTHMTIQYGACALHAG